MTAEELDEWGADFLRFCARFASVFHRKEPRAQAAKYLRGLMASVPRKNSWQVAEAIGDRTPDATQRLLYKAKWNADAARDRLQQFVVEVVATFGDATGGDIGADRDIRLDRRPRVAHRKGQYVGGRFEVAVTPVQLGHTGVIDDADRQAVHRAGDV